MFQGGTGRHCSGTSGRCQLSNRMQQETLDLGEEVELGQDVVNLL